MRPSDHIYDAYHYWVGAATTMWGGATASTTAIEGVRPGLDLPRIRVTDGDYYSAKSTILVCAYCNTEWEPEEGRKHTCAHCGGNRKKIVEVIDGS